MGQEVKANFIYLFVVPPLKGGEPEHGLSLGCLKMNMPWALVNIVFHFI